MGLFGRSGVEYCEGGRLCGSQWLQMFLYSHSAVAGRAMAVETVQQKATDTTTYHKSLPFPPRTLAE